MGSQLMNVSVYVKINKKRNEIYIKKILFEDFVPFLSSLLRAYVACLCFDPLLRVHVITHLKHFQAVTAFKLLR